MNTELIVALDVPSASQIPPIVDSLPEAVVWYKVGLELFTSEGPRAFDFLRDRGKRVFLDLKLHDIPRTVANAVLSAARHGVGMLTIHAHGGRQMLKAAANAAGEAGVGSVELLAVTTLTSLDDSDLRELGICRSVADHSVALAAMALDAGIRGLVCSVHEASAFRQRFGSAPVLVTPGIRPIGTDLGDQKRIATPTVAIKGGATYLVVGRPILEAPDRGAAAAAILREMAQASLQ